MSTPYFNTTGGSWVIFRQLVAVDHDHGGFFGPIEVTGEIICKCHWRVTRAELTELAESALASKAAA